MKKSFTTWLPALVFFLSTVGINAQTIVWPNAADSISVRASQFADASTIRFVRKDTVLNTSLSTFKGWVTIGLASDNPAKSDSAVFFWTPTGGPNVGSYVSAADSRLLGTNETRGLGAALFSSDFLDSRGTGVDKVGQAPSPHSGELWSPIFDATGFNDLSLVFQQANRHFQSAATIDCYQSTAVSWSEDGGVTWKPLQCIEENEGYGFLERLPRNTPTIVKLKGSKGTNKFRIKFHFNGDYYYWLVDDVRVGVFRNNITLSKSWAAVPPANVQRNNIDSTRFMVDVVNNGTVPARNVKLTVDVLNSTTLANVFTTTRNYGTLAVDSTAENELLPQSFLAPNTVANYDIRYKVTYDSADMFQRDDSIYFRNGLQIRDSLLSNVQNNVVPFWYDNGYDGTAAVQAWKLGQYYYFPRGATSTATRISAYVESTETTLTTASAPRNYVASLYEWTDANNNGAIESTERRLIAAGERTTLRGNALSVLDIRLENLVGSGPIYLKNNQAYLAMLELTPTTANVAWYGFFDERARYSSGPMKFATAKAGKPRYSAIIDYDGNDGSSVWETDYYGFDQYVPLVSLYAWPIRINTKDDLDAAYKVNIYPNPVASSNLSVNLDFPKSESAVLLRIFDLKGQLIQEREYMNVQKETLNMDINQLPNGSYFLQVQTVGNQAKTLKFVKAN